MANIRTIDYKGFNNATGSQATGSGFLIWSGSMQLPQGNSSANTQYYGVGIEAIAHSGSYLRFQTDTQGAGSSSLDIKTNKFFLGSDAAYISGSGDGTIAISSSNFELNEAGAIVMQGQITATAGGTIGGFAIGSDNLTATNFILNTADKLLSLGTGNTIFIADADTGIQLGHATFASAPFSVTKAGALKATSGEIAGWTLATDNLSGGNLIISATGSIQTADFQDGITTGESQGWRIGSDGEANFANATIRGTLSTTVFEKEKVSAVGGALIVANATTIASGSLHLSGSIDGNGRQVISCSNVSGFAVGEFLIAKATGSTGFVEEYMKVSSVTASSATMDVHRGLNKGQKIVSMSAGQAIVSQGGNGTGYILLNATSGSETPYMDIVERTGSSLANTKIVARLGDLSGINDTNFSDGVTGYGLYTQNGYFKGKLEIGSVPNQPPIDKLFLHYNFTQPTSSGTILDQTPNQYSSSIGNITNGSYNLAFPGAASGSFQLIVTRSIFDIFTSSAALGSNKFSAGYRFKLDGTIEGKNMFLAKGHGSFLVYKGSGDNINFRIHTTSSNYISFSTPTNTILPNNTYHVFVTGEEDVKAQIYIYQTDSGSAGKPILIQHTTESLSGTHFLFKDLGATYKNIHHGLSGWGSAGTNRPFSGSFFDMRYYNQHVLTEAECHAIMLNPDAGVGGTVIDGNSISTGVIQSTNYSATAGSEIDLNAGTIKLGGTTNPGFQVDTNGLVEAVNFAERMTNVNADNLADYRDSVSGGYRLLFDGSGGGEVTMNMVLRTDPGLIKGVVLPISGSTLNATVNIFPKVEGIRFDDGTVTPVASNVSRLE